MNHLPFIIIRISWTFMLVFTSVVVIVNLISKIKILKTSFLKYCKEFLTQKKKPKKKPLHVHVVINQKFWVITQKTRSIQKPVNFIIITTNADMVITRRMRLVRQCYSASSQLHNTVTRGTNMETTQYFLRCWTHSWHNDSAFHIGPFICFLCGVWLCIFR